MILSDRIFGLLCVITIGLSACAPIEPEPEGEGKSKLVITPIEDVMVDEGLAVSLTANAATEKGTIASYLWQQTSGIDVSLVTSNQQTISFTAPEVDETSTLGFSVTVTNSEGESTTVEVTVVVNNVIATPVIAEITDVTVGEGIPVSLTVNATIEKGTNATYLWQQTSGIDVTLSTPNQPSTSFTAPEVSSTQALGFSVTVTNEQGKAANKEVRVIVIDELSKRALNDTGVTLCGDYAYETLPHQHNSDANCSNTVEVTNGFDPIPTGQDGHKGRDADLSANQEHDGVAGFSFTKLESIGGSSLTADAAQWGCVRDDMTGLIWEVKQDSGLRNKGHTYTWYNSSGVNDGGFEGYSSAEFSSGSAKCEGSSRCDTEKFVEDVNNLVQPLCGYTDWRLPTLSELTSIVNFGSSTVIDSNFFPLTNYEVWSANSFANSHFTQHAWSINLSSGQDQLNSKKSAFAVRLVRSDD